MYRGTEADRTVRQTPTFTLLHEKNHQLLHKYCASITPNGTADAVAGTKDLGLTLSKDYV